MPITGIEHAAIIAVQTEELVAWYQRVLGATIVWASDKVPRAYFLRLGNDLIEMGPAPAGSSPPRLSADAPGLRHLAFTVSDFDAAVAVLREHGPTFTTEELSAARGARTIFFLDPEGNHLQLIWRPEAVR